MSSEPLLFCATDAGGLKSLFPVAHCALARGYGVTVVTRARFASFVDEYADDELRRCVAYLDPCTPSRSRELMSQKSWAAIVCGTTTYPALERSLVYEANLRGIRSIVVLDEWYYYVNRFIVEGVDGPVYPNIIAMQDDYSRELAIAEGIPASCCLVTGSPQIEWLITQIGMFQQSPPRRPEVYGDADKVLVYVSETHAEDYGSEEGGRGALGDYLGYTEHSVRDDILSAFTAECRDVCIVEKAHPSADPSSIAGLLRNSAGGVPFQCVTDAALWPMIWHADAVIGMRSYALLEAAMFGKPTYSYQPNVRSTAVPCTAAVLGLATVLHDRTCLRELARSFCTQPLHGTEGLHLRSGDIGAAERIVDLVRGKAMVGVQ